MGPLSSVFWWCGGGSGGIVYYIRLYGCRFAHFLAHKRLNVTKQQKVILGWTVMWIVTLLR